MRRQMRCDSMLCCALQNRQMNCVELFQNFVCAVQRQLSDEQAMCTAAAVLVAAQLERKAAGVCALPEFGAPHDTHVRRRESGRRVRFFLPEDFDLGAGAQ